MSCNGVAQCWLSTTRTSCCTRMITLYGARNWIQARAPQKSCQTRMHSSRMRTVHCSGGGGCLPGGVCLGVCIRASTGQEGVCPSACWDTHPLDRILDTRLSENITLTRKHSSRMRTDCDVTSPSSKRVAKRPIVDRQTPMKTLLSLEVGNNRFSPQTQGLAPPSEKSWIRHC